MNKQALHIWEAALLLAFALTLLTGACASARSAELAESVLRLHVIANSDSQRDQALKLAVRDAVLEQAAPLLAGAAGRQAAEEALLPHLEELAQAGRAVLAAQGCEDRVTVSLANAWFPTKVYEGFSLPAGQYRALRVVIGDGAGQNWWCVVFPPLCLASVTEETAAAAAEAGLSGDQVALITGQDGGYVLKFKVIELWEALLHTLGMA